MTKFIGIRTGFKDISEEIFGKEIKVLQITESKDSVEFHLQIIVNGVKFNSINKFSILETGKTIVLFNNNEDEFVAEKSKYFPSDF